MNLNKLNMMEEGLEKIAQVLSEQYRENVLPIDILRAIEHLVDADDFDRIARYIAED